MLIVSVRLKGMCKSAKIIMSPKDASRRLKPDGAGHSFYGSSNKEFSHGFMNYINFLWGLSNLVLFTAMGSIFDFFSIRIFYGTLHKYVHSVFGNSLFYRLWVPRTWCIPGIPAVPNQSPPPHSRGLVTDLPCMYMYIAHIDLCKCLQTPSRYTQLVCFH